MFRLRAGCLLGIAILLSVPAFLGNSAHAETTGTGSSLETGSGTAAAPPVVDTGALLLRQERHLRMQRFRAQAIASRAKQEEHRSSRESLRAKQEEHRGGCHLALGVATRADKFPAALRCYRGALTLDLESLRKERTFIEQMPGVSEERRSTALQRMEELIGALLALIEGIDTDVLQSVEDLKETKKNLLLRYRLPFWLAMDHLRAERLLGWLAHAGDRLENVIERETLTGEIASLVTEATACLAENRDRLRSALASNDYQESKDRLSQASASLHTCFALLRQASEKKEESTGSGEIVP